MISLLLLILAVLGLLIIIFCFGVIGYVLMGGVGAMCSIVLLFALIAWAIK